MKYKFDCYEAEEMVADAGDKRKICSELQRIRL
jgi:hypothetical protein